MLPLAPFYQHSANTCLFSGEIGRFVLPDRSVIDDVFEFTLNDYREYQISKGDTNKDRFPKLMVINWVKKDEPFKDTETSNIESEEKESKKAP